MNMIININDPDKLEQAVELLQQNGIYCTTQTPLNSFLDNEPAFQVNRILDDMVKDGIAPLLNEQKDEIIDGVASELDIDLIINHDYLYQTAYDAIQAYLAKKDTLSRRYSGGHHAPKWFVDKEQQRVEAAGEQKDFELTKDMMDQANYLKNPIELIELDDDRIELTGFTLKRELTFDFELYGEPEQTMLQWLAHRANDYLQIQNDKVYLTDKSLQSWRLID